MSKKESSSTYSEMPKTKLQAALWSQKQGMTYAEIAKSAGVSTKTISTVLDGEFSSLSPEFSDLRTLRGRTAIIIRLANYLKLDCAETLKEYRIDPEWPKVQHIIRRIENKLLSLSRRPSIERSLDPNEDLFPLMKIVVESGYEGEVSPQDIRFLLQIQDKLTCPLTPAAAKELLALRHAAPP